MTDFWTLIIIIVIIISTLSCQSIHNHKLIMRNKGVVYTHGNKDKTTVNMLHPNNYCVVEKQKVDFMLSRCNAVGEN